MTRFKKPYFSPNGIKKTKPMSRVLRNFRVKLLQEKDVGGYLVYALGEIFLIVVGILVALWIDNWNEDRQIAKREQFYLAGLHKEFELSRIRLLNLIEANRNSYEQARELVNFMAQADSLPSEAGLARLLYAAFSEDIDYNPNNSLLEEMINSGRLELIGNTALRTHLTSWESRVERIRLQEANLRVQKADAIDLTRTGQASVRSVLELTGVAEGELGLEKSQNPGSNLSLLRSREFENSTLIFIVTALGTEKFHYQPLLEEIDTILALLDQEIAG